MITLSCLWLIVIVLVAGGIGLFIGLLWGGLDRTSADCDDREGTRG